MLPIKLMPPGWPRTRAREVFGAVYDRLVEPAQDHVRTVVARVADGPHLHFRAHTIAEMGAGIESVHVDGVHPAHDSAAGRR